MAKIGVTLRKILVWTYERGTLQYDIICILILVFIFLVPRSCFAPKRQGTAQTDQKQITRPVQPAPAQQ